MTYLKEQIIKEIANSVEMTPVDFKSVLVSSRNAQELIYNSSNVDLLSTYPTIKALAIDVVALTFPTKIMLNLLKKVDACTALDRPLKELLL